MRLQAETLQKCWGLSNNTFEEWKVRKNFETEYWLSCYWRFLQIEYIGINNWDVLRKLWEQIGKVKCCLIKVFALFWVGYKSTQCLFIFHFRLKWVFFSLKEKWSKVLFNSELTSFYKRGFIQKKTTQQYTFCVNVK